MSTAVAVANDDAVAAGDAVAVVAASAADVEPAPIALDAGMSTIHVCGLPRHPSLPPANYGIIVPVPRACDFTLAASCTAIGWEIASCF